MRASQVGQSPLSDLGGCQSLVSVPAAHPGAVGGARAMLPWHRQPVQRTLLTLSHSSAYAQPHPDRVRCLLTAMTINIFSPFPGGPVGPGIEVRSQSINSDVPSGSIWVVEVQDLNVANPPQPLLRHQLPYLGNETGPFGLLGNPGFGTLSWPGFRFGAGQDGTVDYSVRLQSGSTGLVIDEARQPQFWDGSFYYRLAAQAQPAGGFAPADRSNLELVLAAVRTVLPAAIPGGAQLAMNVIDLVRGPPRAFLQPFASQLLTGRGSLSAQPPGALHSFGGTWSWFTVPGGYGKDDGALVEWHRRLAQFVVIREGAGDNTYIDVLEDSSWEGNFILWQFPNPTEIQYDIAPGVQVLWRWLV